MFERREAQAREREAAKGTTRKKVLSAEERTYEGLDKLFAAIDARREPELDRFIFALGIRHIGDTTAAVLAKTFSTIEELIRVGKETAAADDPHTVFPSINGIGDTVIGALRDFFGNERNDAVIDALLKQVTPQAICRDRFGRQRRGRQDRRVHRFAGEDDALGGQGDGRAPGRQGGRLGVGQDRSGRRRPGRRLEAEAGDRARHRGDRRGRLARAGRRHRLMSAAFNGFGKKAIPFLKAIGFHQSREWFAENRDIFERELREPFGDLIDVLSLRCAEAGLGLTGDRKKSMFRINRDIRFAKDKRPYNQHLSAILSPDGTKSSQGVLYVYIGADRCFTAIAWWQPRAQSSCWPCAMSIVRRPAAFRTLVAALAKNGLELDGEERMKRLPRGFEDVTDQQLGEAVRNRHFVVRHTIDPSGIHSPALVDEIIDFTLRAKPLLDWGRKIEGRIVAG